SFTVSDWTGTGTLTGPAADTVIASKSAGFTLTDSNLIDGADAMNLTLAGVHVANLTDTGSGHTFTVSGWTGTGSLSGTGDTVVASKAASFTLSNAVLSSTDNMSLTLGGFPIATLGDTAGSNSFTVSGWTGTGSLTGPATDTVI